MKKRFSVSLASPMPVVGVSCSSLALEIGIGLEAVLVLALRTYTPELYGISFRNIETFKVYSIEKPQHTYTWSQHY